MARGKFHDIYSTIEVHLLRILLIILLLIAAYKPVAIEIGFLRCQ